MDHTVYLDEGEGDLAALRRGTKTMLALGMNERGACGQMSEGDGLLFSLGAERNTVLAKASAAKVTSSPMLSPESCAELLAAHAMALALTERQARQLVTKRYLVLVELRDLVMMGPAAGPSGAASGNENLSQIGLS